MGYLFLSLEIAHIQTGTSRMKASLLVELESDISSVMRRRPSTVQRGENEKTLSINTYICASATDISIYIAERGGVKTGGRMWKLFDAKYNIKMKWCAGITGTILFCHAQKKGIGLSILHQSVIIT
ncbi:hypothetical protein CHS0354_021149 [Potamilus streckersoni]|uniref:Uncharacterized protein n=1 Tax=Potamilus streckersoni TaxID=2493646 RepID=A0AAE0T2R6_9BIVA|nr:hypothetical protein CHS0354_021149 [Potamilus streckersoni]